MFGLSNRAATPESSSDGDYLPTTSVRVLVVDDFEPFRRIVVSTLQKDSELQVIFEAADGLEAVQKAEELQPDLILMDIGLPLLNGIEAARRIRKLSSGSKILFVSQESSADLVSGALAIGANGYVVKTDAGKELLTAVNVVIQGGQFVGKRFSDYDFARTSHAPASEQSLEIAHRHEAGFHFDDAGLLDNITQFIGTALKAGNAAIVVATESHRNSLLPRLQAHGLDTAAAIEQGRFISLDAADTLSAFMLNDMPDPVRFLRLLGNLISTAADAVKGEQARVAVFGECVQLLWAQGNAEAAIEVEKLGTRLAKTYDVDILCGYSLGSVQGGMDDHVFERICAEHSTVYSR
jgi:DNA-binding NarL/FixJ family response regulator